MTNEEQQMFDDLLAMFRLKGWTLMQEDFMQLGQQVVNFDTIEDGDTLQFRKGQLDILRRVLSYEDSVRTQLEQRSEELEESEAA